MEEFKFGYVVYREVDRIAETHPAVYDTFVQKDGDFTKFEPFKGNPDEFDDFPFFFYIEHKGKVICSRFAIPDILFIEKREYQWSWGGGFFTDPSFRGKGLGTKLIKSMVKILHDNNIGHGMVFSTLVSIHIYKKLGYSFLGYVDRYLFFKSIAPFMRKHVESESIVKLVDIVYSPFPKVLYRIQTGKRRSRNSDFECLYVPYDKVSSILGDHSIYRPSKFTFNDKQDKLTFKLRRAKHSRLYLILERESGRPVAYFVIKNRIMTQPLCGYSDFKLMSLMDYGFFSENSLYAEELANEVFKIFFNSDAEVLDAVVSQKPLQRILKKKGMLKIGKGMSFVFSVPSTWNMPYESSQLSSWQLSHFSGDGYSFV